MTSNDQKPNIRTVYILTTIIVETQWSWGCCLLVKLIDREVVLRVLMRGPIILVAIYDVHQQSLSMFYLK